MKSLVASTVKRKPGQKRKPKRARATPKPESIINCAALLQMQMKRFLKLQGLEYKIPILAFKKAGDDKVQNIKTHQYIQK